MDGTGLAISDAELVGVGVACMCASVPLLFFVGTTFIHNICNLSCFVSHWI